MVGGVPKHRFIQKHCHGEGMLPDRPLPTASTFGASQCRARAMLNIEAFRELCRRAAAEKDPAKLERLKNELTFMLQSEGIEMERLEKKPGLKPN
jgi:hypothetical protein